MNPLSFELHTLLAKQAAIFSSEEIKLAKELRLSLREMECLCTMTSLSQYSIKDMAKITCLSGSQLSRVLSRLEDKGLIVRSIDKKDHRNVDVVVTEDGSALTRKIEECWEKILDNIVQSLPSEQIEGAMNFFRTFINMNKKGRS